jgi:small multidrug resistance pump
MAHLYLFIAIVGEVAATSALKSAEGFTRLLPSIVVIVGYGIAFYFLSLVLKTIPVGIAYAVWSGLGIAIITVIGAILFKQIPDLPAIVGMLFIIAGVAIINLFSNTVTH